MTRRNYSTPKQKKFRSVPATIAANDYAAQNPAPVDVTPTAQAIEAMSDDPYQTSRVDRFNKEQREIAVGIVNETIGAQPNKIDADLGASPAAVAAAAGQPLMSLADVAATHFNRR